MQRRIVLTVLVAVTVGLVIGVATTTPGLTCEEWQAEYAELASKTPEGGVLGFVRKSAVADGLRELEQDRPEGCANPEP